MDRYGDTFSSYEMTKTVVIERTTCARTINVLAHTLAVKSTILQICSDSTSYPNISGIPRGPKPGSSPNHQKYPHPIVPYRVAPLPSVTWSCIRHTARTVSTQELSMQQHTSSPTTIPSLSNPLMMSNNCHVHLYELPQFLFHINNLLHMSTQCVTLFFCRARSE